MKIQTTTNEMYQTDCISYRRGKIELYNKRKFVINLEPSLIKQIIVNENELPNKEEK